MNGTAGLDDAPWWVKAGVFGGWTLIVVWICLGFIALEQRENRREIDGPVRARSPVVQASIDRAWTERDSMAHRLEAAEADLADCRWELQQAEARLSVHAERPEGR